MELLHFQQALDALGKTEIEKAKRLGITTRALSLWKSKKLPRAIYIIVSHPDIAAALAADAHEHAKSQIRS
ncbi:MAG: hypothetical protein MI924_00250 [Chloroflexales bacterium]|nr:hypothetical protein [Chloroflexales bacterium]